MPPRRTTRSAAPAAAPPEPSVPAKRRATRVKAEPEETAPDDLEPDQPALSDDDEDGTPPRKKNSSRATNGSRATAKSKAKAAPVKVEAEEPEAEAEAEASPPPVKNGRHKRSATRSISMPKKRTKRVAGSDEDEDSDGTPQPNGQPSGEAIPSSDGDDFTPAPRDSRSGSSSKRGAKSNGTSGSRTSSKRTAPKAGAMETPLKPFKPKSTNGNQSTPDDEDPDDIPDFAPSPAKSRVSVTPRPAPTPVEDPPSDEEEEDLMAAIRNAPRTPRQSVAPSQAPGNASVAREDVAEPVPAVPSGPVTRLVIHKLVLLNFKSYAGRQEIGPFHKSFSAIVGPNGSGKSNTIDALLFVFGYRASKMRQGKLSELIHFSADYPDFDECRVEVWFREIEDLPGPDVFNVVPGSGLIVARSAMRNNSSVYTINHQRSNFTEVTTLLKARGIDLDHKRFLILQGEVESIAQMKPKAPTEHEDGLLEYLEDIIGTSKYKEPIDEALVEVDRLNEERAEKLNRLRLIEKDKAGLEEKKKEAEAWLRNKNELVRAQNKYYQYYMMAHAQEATKLEEAHGTLTEQLEQEKAKNKDNISEIDALKQNYEERAKAFEVVQKETAPLVKQLQSLEKQEVQVNEKRKHIMTKGKKMTKSLKEDIHAKSDAEEWIRNHTEAIEKYKAEVDKLEAELEVEEGELEKITDSLKDKTQVFHAQIEVKQKELEPWNTKINAKQAAVDIATNERNMLNERSEAVRKGVEEAENVVKSLLADKATKEEEMSNKKAELASLRKKVDSAEKKLQSLDEQEQKLRSKAASLRSKTDEAKASQAASTSQSAVLEGLTKLKAAGRIKGFHGRLGDLGTIAEKYDVAMSTACPGLNNLVVDQVDQGNACVKYLKDQSIGRATFFVLEKLSSNIPQVQTPENAPRLFDLIKPKDARFAPAFYKAIRDTLVAETLEQANRIAFGGQRRWRVVTLAGQLIDISGTMSGGGTRVMKGLMSAKFASDTVRPEVVRQYEQEAEEAQLQLDSFLQDKRGFTIEVEELQKQVPVVEMAISKAELDIQGGMKRAKDAQIRLKELQSQSKPDAGDLRRIQSLDAEIASVAREVDSLTSQASGIQKEIQRLQDKILEIGGTRLRFQKAKVDGIKEKTDLANEQITKAEVGKAKSEKDAEKLDHSITAAENQLGELKAEVEELDALLATCVDDMTGLREKVEMAQEIAEQHTQELEEMKVDLRNKQELLNKFRSKEMALQQKLDLNAKALTEERHSVKSLKERLKKLALDEDVEEEDDDEDDQENPNPPTAEDSVKQETSEEIPRAKPNSYELQVYTEDEIAQMNPDSLKGEVAKLEGLIGEGQPNMKALEEYRRREADFLKRVKDMDEITAARDNMKKRYDDLRKTRLDEFMGGFSIISSRLKEMYQMITLGGNAELELVDSMDPFSEGIIFSVMPPKKSWKNISNLSGGEKTLSSLALVFALHVFKPTPLYFMDEIDAALDFRNVSIVANYIKDRTKNAQFIIISLRNDMFELSHRLIGIYKTSNATRSISIHNKPLTSR